MGTDPTRGWVCRLLTCLLLLSAPILLAACDAQPLRSDPLENSTRILGRRAWVTVTMDGGRRVVTRRSVRLERGDTALDLLAEVADVRLDPTGAIAQVNGRGGGALGAFGPEAKAWFFRVDGIESFGVKPDRFYVKPGQSLWWDLRRVDIYERLPVAVGAFPQPMFSGWRDTHRPLRIAYGKGLKKDAEYLRDSIFHSTQPDVVSLQGDTGVAGIGGEDDRGSEKFKTTVAVRRARNNIVIGRWEQVRMDPFVIDLGTAPREFGLTAWVEGTDIYRQDPDMEFSERLPEAEGLIWASTTDGEPDGTIVFMITGITDDGVRAALRALRSGSCQFYIACAVTRDGEVIR